MTLEGTEIVGTEFQTPVEIAESAPSLTADEVFPTDPLPLPPAIPDAHRAAITGVEVRRYENEKGTVSLVVHLISLDIPTLATEFEIFLPKLFVEDIKVDPTTLPDEDGNKQRTVYRMHVASEDGRATLQRLRKLAADAHRTIEGVGITQPSTDIETFAENHSKLLTGLECVFYRATDSNGDNSEFANRLRVKGILPYDAVNKPPKVLAKMKCRKMWLPDV
jgi:hypothetical protein